jgi:hypothetical protein
VTPSGELVKGKGKARSRTGLEVPEEEQRYRSTLSLTSTLDGGGWLTPSSGCFTPGKEIRYPFYRRLDGPNVWNFCIRKRNFWIYHDMHFRIGMHRTSTKCCDSPLSCRLDVGGSLIHQRFHEIRQLIRDDKRCGEINIISITEDVMHSTRLMLHSATGHAKYMN